MASKPNKSKSSKKTKATKSTVDKKEKKTTVKRGAKKESFLIDDDDYEEFDNYNVSAKKDLEEEWDLEFEKNETNKTKAFPSKNKHDDDDFLLDNDDLDLNIDEDDDFQNYEDDFEKY